MFSVQFLPETKQKFVQDRFVMVQAPVPDSAERDRSVNPVGVANGRRRFAPLQPAQQFAKKAVLTNLSRSKAFRQRQKVIFRDVVAELKGAVGFRFLPGGEDCERHQQLSASLAAAVSVPRGSPQVSKIAR